jgi:large subunit ribosomal protein L25
MAKNAPNNLPAAIRKETGKGASRRARRNGKVVAVLYGHGSDPQHLELNAHDFAAVLRHAGTNAVLTLDIEGNEQLALTKALTLHPIRRSITHADLLVVRRGEKVTVEVNVLIEGEATPGTLVTQDTNTITIEADVQSIPENLTISIEGADIGTQFTADAIPLPDGVSLISDPETLVVNVVAAPTEQDLEAEGAGEAGGEEAEGEATEGESAEGEGEGEAGETPAADSE